MVEDMMVEARHMIRRTRRASGFAHGRATLIWRVIWRVVRWGRGSVVVGGTDKRKCAAHTWAGEQTGNSGGNALWAQRRGAVLASVA